MAMEEVRKRLTIETQSAGLDGTAASINKVADAEARLAVTSTSAERAQLSLDTAFGKLERRYVDEVRQKQEMAKIQQTVNAAVAQNPALQERANAVLQGAAMRLNQVHAANENVAKSTGLARHELINLSRQAQDVGVSLASGQSPFTVLIQQGSQIGDVFASSSGSVRGFFTQAIGWAGRFATSTAGVVTATVALGGAATYAAIKWNEAQVDISRSLIGIGRQSGASLTDVNRIVADTAKNTKSSTGEARDLAIALTNTGRIGVAQIDSLTKRGHDFAKVLGMDLPEANKLMAESFADPAKGVDVLGDKFGGFSAKLRQEVKDLAGQFRFAEAQQAMERGLIPTLNRAGEASSSLSKIVEGTSKFFKELGSQAGRGLDRILGDNPVAEKLTGATNERNRLQEAVVDRAGQRAMSGGRPTFVDARLERDLENATKKVAEFQAEVDRVNGDKLTQIGNDAVAVASAIVTDVAQINALKNSLQGFDQILGNAKALELLSPQQVELVQRARDLARDWTGYVGQLRAAYGNVSQVAAQQLQSLQLATNLANARTAAEQQAAQYAIDYAAALAQTKNSAEAVLIATQQRVLAEAQVNAEADKRLRQLQEEGQLIRASSDDERDRIKAAQEYNRLIEARVDPLKAGAIAAQMQANARSERDAREQAQADQDAARAAQDHASAAREAAAASERIADAAAEAQRRWEAAAQALKFLPFYLLDTMGAMDKLFDSNQGGKSQFNPEGYKFKTATATSQFANNVYGAGGFDTTTGQPNAQGIANLVNTYLAGGRTMATANWQSGGGVMGAIEGLLSGAGGTTGGSRFGSTGLDANTLGLVQQLTDLLPDQQKAGVIERELSLLKSQPQNIETLQAIKTLTDSLNQLKSSTDGLKEAMTDVLSPFYSNDPRQTKLGFRPFAGGGIMSPWGEIPINNYAGGGIANSPQVAVFGEGHTPEAYVPVPTGRIPVTINQPANNNTPQKIDRPISVTVYASANVSRDEARKTGFHIAQEINRRLA